MKKLICTSVIITLFAFSCNKDNVSNGPELPENGEKSVVSLIIRDATLSSGARAAGDQEDPPTLPESAIDAAAGIKVVVFDETGKLNYPVETGHNLKLNLTETSPSSGIYRSDEFTINAGQKYFYVFLNDEDDLVTRPAVTMTREQFIAKTTPTSLSSADVLNITTTNFLIGTLWSEKEMAPGGGEPGSPKVVEIPVGRLAAKVNLLEVSKGTSNMLGTFTNPEYRLGTIPRNIFFVGNNDESKVAPPAIGHGVVSSAVHTAPYYTGVSDANFIQYTNTWKNINDAFYSVENTTEPVDGIQYYGNSTYIQLKTTYTPDDSEVYDPETLAPIAGPFVGPTFYSAVNMATGGVLLFEKDPTEPSNNPHTDIDQNSVFVYTNGLNYHKFAVHDLAAGLDDVQKYTVLRNHSYKYKITNIKNLGSSDEKVDPKEPIENPTTIVLEVEVAPWSKIEGDISI